MNAGADTDVERAARSRPLWLAIVAHLQITSLLLVMGLLYLAMALVIGVTMVRLAWPQFGVVAVLIMAPFTCLFALGATEMLTLAVELLINGFHEIRNAPRLSLGEQLVFILKGGFLVLVSIVILSDGGIAAICFGAPMLLMSVSSIVLAIGDFLLDVAEWIDGGGGRPLPSMTGNIAEMS